MIFFRFCFVRQSDQCSGRHPSNEWLPDRHEKTKSSIKKAERCQQAILTYGQHFSGSSVPGVLPPAISILENTLYIKLYIFKKKTTGCNQKRYILNFGKLGLELWLHGGDEWETFIKAVVSSLRKWPIIYNIFSYKFNHEPGHFFKVCHILHVQKLSIL